MCRKLVCAECMPNHTLTSISCSFCDISHENSFTPASDVVLKVLGTLLLQCDQPSCTAVVQLQNLKSHLESGCKRKAPSYSPSKLTVGQLLSRPLQSPPTTMEQKAATCILKRMMASTSQDHPAGSCVVKMPTAGTVSNSLNYRLDCTYHGYITYAPAPYTLIPSSIASELRPNFLHTSFDSGRKPQDHPSAEQ